MPFDPIALSDSLAALVDQSAASVVRVDGRAHRGASGVVHSADGLIVTAHHAVEREEGITVAFADGKTANATLLGRDPGTDLAVLRADASGLAPARWAEGAPAPRVGHLVMALARPGKTVRATMGVLSTLGTEEFRTPAGGRLEHYLQADVNLPPGFSGGPLLDLSGRALGVNTVGIVRGLGLTVPAATVKRVVGEIASHGQIRRGYLGVGVYPVRLPAALEQSLGQKWGVIVVAVEPGSPAEQGGIVLGDVLVALDGKALERPTDLAFLLEDKVAAGVTLRVVRGGQTHDVSVTTKQRE